MRYGREAGSDDPLHGGRFVIAAGLTLADQQRDSFFGELRERFSDLLPVYERLYPPGCQAAVRSSDAHSAGRRIRELCRQVGISDRMPRPIIPGDKRALNKRIVDALANECYSLEMDDAPGSGCGLITRWLGRSRIRPKTWG